MEKGEGITGVAKLDLTRSRSHSQADVRLTGCVGAGTDAQGGEKRESQGDEADSPDCIVGRYNLGKGRKGGEPIFVPRPAENGKEQEEDDGYLLFLVYDSKTE